MAYFAVTAVGADRPGIVAAVTGAFLEHGCNLEDTSMTILRGQFAMMLVVAAPGGVSAAELEAALLPAAESCHLVLIVRPIDEAVPARSAAEEAAATTWTVSIYGADHPGIVHRVASLLAAESVNIVDLSTRVIGSAERPVYAMLLDVSVPPTTDAAEVGERLRVLAGELEVDCTLHPSDADIL